MKSIVDDTIDFNIYRYVCVRDFIASFFRCGRKDAEVFVEFGNEMVDHFYQYNKYKISIPKFVEDFKLRMSPYYEFSNPEEFFRSVSFVAYILININAERTWAEVAFAESLRLYTLEYFRGNKDEINQLISSIRQHEAQLDTPVISAAREGYLDQAVNQKKALASLQKQIENLEKENKVLKCKIQEPRNAPKDSELTIERIQQYITNYNIGKEEVRAIRTMLLDIIDDKNRRILVRNLKSPSETHIGPTTINVQSGATFNDIHDNTNPSVQ